MLVQESSVILRQVITTHTLDAYATEDFYHCIASSASNAPDLAINMVCSGKFHNIYYCEPGHSHTDRQNCPTPPSSVPHLPHTHPFPSFICVSCHLSLQRYYSTKFNVGLHHLSQGSKVPRRASKVHLDWVCPNLR